MRNTSTDSLNGAAGARSCRETPARGGWMFLCAVSRTGFWLGLLLALPASLILFPTASPAADDTLVGALARAYQHNPVLNAERARQRSTDETVPIALAGYRPRLDLNVNPSLIAVRALMYDGERQSETLRGYTAQLMLNQTLFNGFKTGNQVRQAEASVRAGRETLRSVEQTVLLDAVAAYGNVLANQSLVEAQRANVGFLRDTIATIRERLQAGDVTQTDVAQAEARLSRVLADLNTAEVNLAVSRAAYRQVIGVRPGRVAPTAPIERLLPRTEEEAVAVARREHPAVLAATLEVDVAQFAIKVAESALYPTINLQGTLMRQENADPLLLMRRMEQASLVGQINAPLYDGGLAAAQVRQTKEMLAQTRFGLDRVRLATESAAIGAWEMNEGAKAGLRAAEAEVRAATVALEGVQREARVGQRAVLDLLNAQQELVGARARLIGAQRDRFVASYTLLSAIGRLDPKRLGLPTPTYEPQTHYHQVRDAWHGLRTPDGR